VIRLGQLKACLKQWMLRRRNVHVCDEEIGQMPDGSEFQSPDRGGSDAETAGDKGYADPITDNRLVSEERRRIGIGLWANFV